MEDSEGQAPLVSFTTSGIYCKLCTPCTAVSKPLSIILITQSLLCMSSLQPWSRGYRINILPDETITAFSVVK